MSKLLSYGIFPSSAVSHFAAANKHHNHQHHLYKYSYYPYVSTILLYLRTMYFNGNCFGYSSSYVGQRVCMYVYACKRWKDPPISLESTYISGSNIIDAYTESIHINISLGSGRHYPRVIGFDQSRGTLSTHRSHMGRER